MGPPAARTELLVIARLRRARGERQAANESAADSGRADRAAVKLRITAKPRSGENEVQARSFRWRSAVVLGLVVAGGCAPPLQPAGVPSSEASCPFRYRRTPSLRPG